MALWGNNDTKSVTGTLSFTSGSTAVTGAGTQLNTQLAPGQRIVATGGQYQIASIESATALTLVSNATATSTTETVTANEKPAYLDSSDASATFGVDVAEAAATPTLTQSGWVLQTTRSGGRAGRVSFETLVGMKTISGDAADDAVLPDA